MNFIKASAALNATINSISKMNGPILTEIHEQIKNAISCGETMIDYYRTIGNRKEVVKYLEYHGYRVWFKEGDTLAISWETAKDENIS